MKKFNNGVIILSKEETMTWEGKRGDGEPTAHALREKVREEAEKLLEQGSGKRTVEIYASKSEGGWVADIVTKKE